MPSNSNRGKRALYVVLACLHVSFAARTSGFAEYSFVREKCIEGDPFPNTGTNVNAGGTSLISFLNTGRSYECPALTVENEVFQDASNGITSREVAGTSAAMSSADLDTTVFSSDTTFEFWLFASGKDTNRVLMEIGRDASSGVLNSWDLGVDYDLRVAFADSFNIRISHGGIASVSNVASAQAALGPLDLHHLAIIVKPADGGLEVKSFVNAISASSLAGGSSTIPFAVGESRLMIGGSFESRVPGSEVESFDEDVHFFAIHNRELSSQEITDNFEAGLPDANLPAVVGETTLEKLEDVDLIFSLQDLVFDFDSEFVPGANYDNIRVGIVTLPDSEHGTLTDDDNKIAVTAGDLFALGTSFRYKQKIGDEDTFLDSFTFRGSDIILNPSDSFTGTLNLQYVEQNDPPQKEDSVFDVQETKVSRVKLVANEPLDGGIGKNPANLVNRFTITQIDSSSGDGVFFSCDGDASTPLAVNEVISPVTADATNKVFSVEICYAAASFEDRVDALLATDTISFKASDSFSDSPTGTTTVNVLSGLSAGCDFIVNDNCAQEEVAPINGGFVEVTLKAVDAKCDFDGSDPEICAQRKKQFLIAQPLPDPAEGVIKVLDEAETSEITVTEAALNEDNEFLVPGDRNTVRFYPSDNYFNRAEAPICVVNADVDEKRPECISNSPSVACIGDFCGSKTTGLVVNDNRRIFGTCAEGSDQISGGCPIRFFYRLLIGQGKSPVNDASLPGVVLWIDNKLEDSTIVTGDENYDGFNSEQTMISTKGAPIALHNPDGDVMIIKTILDPTSCSIKINEVDADKHPPDLDFLQYDGNILQETSAPLIISGLQPDLNGLLEKLRLSLNKGSSSGVLQISVLTPYRRNSSSNGVTFKFNFQKSLSDDNNQKGFAAYKEFYLFAAFALLLLLFVLVTCCLKCKSCACAVWHNGRLAFSKGTRGKKVNRGRAYSENSSELERLRKRKWSYKCGVVCWWVGGPYILSYICPCLWKIEEEKTESVVGDEDDMEEGEVRATNVNPDDWEKKEDLVSGRKVVTWMNLRTGKEQYNSPFGSNKKKQKKFGQKNGGSLEHGEMKLKSKLFKSHRKMKRFSGRDEPNSTSEIDSGARKPPVSKNKVGEMISTRGTKNKSREVRSARAKFKSRSPEANSGAKKFKAKPPPRPKDPKPPTGRQRVDYDSPN